MDKILLQEYYDYLSKILAEFIKNKSEHAYSKNKSSKNIAKNNWEFQLYLLDDYLKKNPQLFHLITEGFFENIKINRFFLYEEFITFKYFEKDCTDFLRELEKIILYTTKI